MIPRPELVRRVTAALEDSPVTFECVSLPQLREVREAMK